jgi:FkbM family methyltransferase
MLRSLKHTLSGPWRTARAALLMARYRAIRVRTAFHGSAYGGWTIWPDGLTPESIVYSFGVGKDASFDLALIEHYGVEVHAFDPTPQSIAWVEQQSWPVQFHFHPIGLGASDRVATFFPPSDATHISHSILSCTPSSQAAIQVQLQRLSTIAEQLGHRTISILKMDIEGAEYEVIDDLLHPSSLIIQQVLIEFHPSSPGIERHANTRAIRQLEAAGYRLFSISSRGSEYSFIRL